MVDKITRADGSPFRNLNAAASEHAKQCQEIGAIDGELQLLHVRIKELNEGLEDKKRRLKELAQEIEYIINYYRHKKAGWF